MTRTALAERAEPNAWRPPTSALGSASSCARWRTAPSAGPGQFVPFPSAGTTGTPDGSGYSVPYRLIFLGLLIALGVLLIVVPIAKSAWRRRLLRRSREPREHVLAAYRVFDGEAADLGLGRREGETLDEHRARLAAAIAFTDGHLGRLTTQATRAAYAADAPTPEEARSAVEDAHEAIRELRKDAGLDPADRGHLPARRLGGLSGPSALGRPPREAPGRSGRDPRGTGRPCSPRRSRSRRSRRRTPAGPPATRR